MTAWVPRRVPRDAARIGSAIARWAGPRAGTGSLDGIVVGGAPVTARVVRVGGATATLDPDGAVATVRGGPEVVLAVGGGGLVRGLAQAILGGPAELAAARPPTAAEQAVWAYAVAAALDAAGVVGGVSVEPSAIAPAMVAATVAGGALVELAVDGGGARGAAWLAVPAAMLDRPAPRVALDELARGGGGGGWLDAVTVEARAVIAHAALTVGEIGAIAARDVIVVGEIGHGHGHGHGHGVLRVARGEVAVTIDRDRVTVRAPYQRGRMDEMLGDDLTVELAVSAGTVTVSARKLLELAPGEVLALGRPASGQVELVVGRRVIGTGELIDVDGEMAVRVVTVAPR
jgi:flagellar motor switch/type III secretory pathway protein FliN